MEQLILLIMNQNLLELREAHLLNQFHIRELNLRYKLVRLLASTCWILVVEFSHILHVRLFSNKYQVVLGSNLIYII